ncbi:hypothetical protein ACIGHB_23175 [Streptomyces sp. NPDC085460]|uniref:hypothetical protein n=1 Tax=Streptomyces sp. NPDC085460 TaxID=3365723 RepID=UPI0037D6FB27
MTLAPPQESIATPGGPRFAGAFADDAVVSRPDLGAALAAEVRAGADGSAHVLIVTNLTDEAQELLPEPLLPDGPGPLLFLGGASTTSERDGRLVARLLPHGFVRLGRASDTLQEQTA